MSKLDSFFSYLEELYPEPTCELNYNKDYELLMAVVLSAQTTDKRVNEVTKVLFSKYPNLKAIIDASRDDLLKIIKPIGMYQRKTTFVQNIASDLYYKYKGRVPHERESLESLSGVGRKVANVVLSILFNEPCIAVDTHVSRVAKRLGIANKNDDVNIIEYKLNKALPKDKLADSHYRMVLYGRYHCQAIKPNCSNCKVKQICKYEKKDR